MFVAVVIVGVSAAVARLAGSPLIGLWVAVGLGFLNEGVKRTPWVALCTGIGGMISMLLLPQVQMHPSRGPGPIGSIILNLFFAAVGFAVGLAIEVNQGPRNPPLDE